MKTFSRSLMHLTCRRSPWWDIRWARPWLYLVAMSRPGSAEAGPPWGGQPEVQRQPARQVLDLAADRLGHGLGEREVLVDRAHPEQAGLPVGGRVELAG